MHDRPVALITGAARRIGAAIARRLHAAGYDLVLHYRSSQTSIASLRQTLESARPHSVHTVQADLLDPAAPNRLVAESTEAWGRLDALINNASAFQPTPFGSASAEVWDEIMGANLRAPFFLCQAAAAELRRSQGAIVNLTDIYADRPLHAHSIYCISKAGLVMLTRALALELGPDVRVNAVAPGNILWPEHGMDHEARQRLIEKSALRRQGSPEDVAATVAHLLIEATYTTGQVIRVDGGRSVVG